MATTAETVASGSSNSRVLPRALGVIAVAFLAYQALRFFVRSPLSYLLDYSERTFRDYWPLRGVLLFHIAGGTLALFAGPTQFWGGLRRRYPAVHRWTGRTYVASVLLGGAAAFNLSWHTSPRDFGVALFMLAWAWWLVTGMAFVAIRRRQIAAHREWMIRSYVVTFAFVTFRWSVDWTVWAFLGPSRAATVGWLCWVAPLLVTEVVLQWRRTVGPVRPAAARAFSAVVTSETPS